MCACTERLQGSKIVQSHHSIIKDLFCGSSTSWLTCSRCQKHSTGPNEPFFSLCLPVLCKTARAFRITVVPAQGQPFVLTDVPLPKTGSVAHLKTVIISAVSDCRDLSAQSIDRHGKSTYWVLSTAKAQSPDAVTVEMPAPLDVVQDEEAPLEVFYSHQMLYMHELPEATSPTGSSSGSSSSGELLTVWHCQLESMWVFDEDVWELVRVDRWNPFGVPLLFNVAIARGPGAEEKLRRGVCSRLKGGGRKGRGYRSFTHSERLAKFF